MTTGLREAMDDVRHSVAVLAARVRDAHAARAWLPLRHSIWEAPCRADFGISRAQAYRLLDVARASPPTPKRPARETPARPPRPRSTTACPSAVLITVFARTPRTPTLG